MKFSREALEWEDARALVTRRAATAAGARLLEQLEPSTDRAAIGHSLAEAAEGIAYLRAAAAPQAPGRGAAIRISLGGLPDIEQSVLKLQIEGAALDMLFRKARTHYTWQTVPISEELLHENIRFI